MRKYRAQPTPRRTGGLLCLACLLLLALSTCLFALAPTALASSSRAIASSPLAQDITRAGVSVVRLVVQYVNGNIDTSVGAITCTGLGVQVGDWATDNATEQTVSFLCNWIFRC